MHKLFISLAGSGFVLLSGLVSCSQEKKTLDVYDTKPPLLRTSRGSHEIKSWAALTARQLDLHDTLDFSESPAARVSIVADCYEGTEHRKGEGTFTSSAKVQIWQVMPVQVLTADLSKEKYTCSFELNLFNENGSRHVYPVPPTQIVEREPASAQIARDGGQLPDHFVPTDLQNVRVRYENQERAAAKLICQDLEIKSLSFEQVLEFSHFDLLHPVAREASTPNAWQANPIQSCRALITAAGAPRAISNLIKLQMPLPEFKIEDAPVVLTTGNQDENLTLIMDFMQRRRHPPLWAWRITNPSAAGRFLKFPKAPVANELLMRWSNGPQQQERTMIAMNSTILELKSKSKITEETAQTWTVLLGPGETIFLQATFIVGNPFPCSASVNGGLRFQKFTPFVIAEVSGDDFTLGTFQLRTPDQSLFLNPQGVDFSAGQEMSSCPWR